MKEQKVPIIQKLGLMMGSGGITGIFSLTTMLAMLFFTDLMGLSPAAVGTMILLSKIWNAMCDPLCGALIDRTNTRFGKVKPWLFFGGIGIFLFGVLIFVVPGFSSTGKLVWSYITYNGVCMSFAACTIALITLMPLITRSQMERVSLSAFSFIGQTVFAIIATATVMPLITFFSRSAPVNAYWKTALVIGGVGFLCTMFFVIVVKEKSAVQAEGEKARTHIRDSLKAILRNKYFVLIVAICLANGIAIGMHNSSMAQYLIYGLKAPELASLLMPIIYIGAFAAGMLAKPLARFDKLRMAKIAFVILAAGLALRFFTGDAFLPAVIAGELAVGIGSGLFNVYVIAMLMDTSEYGYKKTKVRNDGLIMSTMSFQTKIGQGLGIALMGFWLELGGYVSGAAEQPQSAADALFNIHLVPFLIVAVLSFILLHFYKLDDKAMAEIMKEEAEAL